MIKATIHYWHNAIHCQKQVFAETEEELLLDAFMFRIDMFETDRTAEISYIDYQGKQLPWNEFAAHQHFAKGRLSFEEFKTMCLETVTQSFSPSINQSFSPSINQSFSKSIIQ